MKCKKLVPCHDCKGKGYITLALGVDDLCGIGSKTCESCNGLGEVWETMTNADRIRAMSYEEKAREFVFFCPTDAVFRGEDTYGKPHYTGFDGKYYSTSEEVIDANLKWLKQPAEEAT